MPSSGPGRPGQNGHDPAKPVRTRGGSRVGEGHPHPTRAVGDGLGDRIHDCGEEAVEGPLVGKLSVDDDSGGGGGQHGENEDEPFTIAGELEGPGAGLVGIAASEVLQEINDAVCAK